MENILERILENTRAKLTERKALMPVENLMSYGFAGEPTRDLVKSLRTGSGIIAEHKRKSPSKGTINAEVELAEVVTGYQKAGASAISVLTDQQFFGGSLADLRQARKLVDIPLLRKDFIVDQYQIYEARAYGADAILLIAAALSIDLMEHLANKALGLDLQILFEVHNREELNRVCRVLNQLDTTKIAIGINNRNLKEFKTDIAISRELYSRIPDNILAVSESGISDAAIVSELKKLGFQGFLIGEHFMKQQDPADACRKFISKI